MADWENYKPKWYKAVIKVPSDLTFEEILKWIDTNIQGHRKHTVWRLTGSNHFEIRFRFERDFSLFILRWG